MRHMRTIARLLSCSLLAAGALFGLSAVAQAKTPDSGVVSSAPASTTEAKQTTTYWTAARMAAAKPADLVVAGQAKPSGPDTGAKPGPEVSVAPSGPAGQVLAPTPFALASGVSRPYTSYPAKVNGKVFFTKAIGGNFVCSGTAVNSDNKSVVWTAGHCVHNGSGGGGFHRNWMFVPAYSSSTRGDAPFGSWTARSLTTASAWATNGTFRQDFGAAVVNRISNVRLVDKIGADGITFNGARNQSWSAFGYPQDAPFNGFDQYRCNSGRLADDAPSGVGPLTMKIDCNMTGGASGGGWLIGIGANGLGTVNGLNSYKYGNLPNNLFGPYFGNEGLAVYNAVKAAAS